jgi:arylsulfatase
MRCLTRLLTAMSALATLAACSSTPQPTEVACHAQRAPNIILVVADDLGYGELGCYGQTKIRTPNIDRLAAEGARFTQFYSAAPVCAPSRAALMTGLHLGHSPIRDNSEVEPEGQGPLPQNATTLADDLHAAGFATACIGKWGLGFVGSTGDPNANGFDLFYGFNCQRQAHNYYPTHLWRNGEKIVLEGNTPKSRVEAVFAPDLMLEAATSFIDDAKDAPFFLAFMSTMPHMAMQPTAFDLHRYKGAFEETPYIGGKGYLSHPTPRAGYAAMITRLDADVGALRAAIERNGLSDNTIIIVTSDNGPTHDVGGVDTTFFDSTAGLRGRKGSVWEGGIRVPCVVWWPSHIDAARVINTPAWSVDLRASLASFARATAVTTDGVDLSALLVKNSPLAARTLYWPFPGYGGQQAVREGDWKLVRRDLAAHAKKATVQATDHWQLYNLAADPNETTDVAAQHPDVVARLALYASEQYEVSAEFPLPGVH